MKKESLIKGGNCVTCFICFRFFFGQFTKFHIANITKYNTCVLTILRCKSDRRKKRKLNQCKNYLIYGIWLLNPMPVLLNSEKKVYMLRIGFINLIIISKMPPSYLKKNCLPSLGLLIGFILIRQKRRRQTSKSFKNGLELIFKIHVLVSLSLNLLIFLNYSILTIYSLHIT